MLVLSNRNRQTYPITPKTRSHVRVFWIENVFPRDSNAIVLSCPLQTDFSHKLPTKCLKIQIHWKSDRRLQIVSRSGWWCRITAENLNFIDRLSPNEFIFSQIESLKRTIWSINIFSDLFLWKPKLFNGEWKSVKSSREIGFSDTPRPTSFFAHVELELRQNLQII